MVMLVYLFKTNIETIDKGNKYKKTIGGNLYGFSGWK